MTIRRAITRRARAGRLLIVGSALVVAAIVPADASARARPPAQKKGEREKERDKEACVAEFGKGKEQAEAARLLGAKDSFAGCARAGCGAFLQLECGRLYSQLGADIPSVVPFVTDELGTPRALVEVKVDGVVLTSRLDGHALPIDPGKHEFAFATDDGIFATRKIMILQGQHNIPVKALMPTGRRRREAVAGPPGDPALRKAAFETAEPQKTLSQGQIYEELAAPRNSSSEPTPEPAVAAGGLSDDNDAQGVESVGMVHESPATSTRRIPTASYVLGGVGLAGIAGYFVLNTWGRKDNDALGACASAGQLCFASDVEHVRRLYLAANISGGVGLAALATSAWLYMRSSPAPEAAALRTASRGLSRPAASIRMVDVHASPLGAMATIGGAF